MAATLGAGAAGEQQTIFARVGYALASAGVPVVVGSLSSGDISLTCSSGFSDSVTPDPYGANPADPLPSGTDYALYAGTITITGLSAFTQYTYTITQGSNSISGSFYTLPASDLVDFCFYVGGCDTSSSINTAINELNGHGIYNIVRAQIKSGVNPPCVGWLFHDDHGYAGNRQFDDTGYTNHASTGAAQTTLEVYDFFAAYANYYGLHGNLADVNTGNASNADRVWAMRNIPVWPQWGDWEFGNDLGFDAPTTNDPTANGFHATYDVTGVGQNDGGGRVAWEALFTPLQPPLLNGVNSNAWSFTIGPLLIVAMDNITNGDGSVTTFNPPDAVTTQYGNDQIDDVLAAVAAAKKPFTILSQAIGVQYLSATPTNFTTGAQSPLLNHCPAEFARLFTDNTGLMGLPQTNGQQGCLIDVHGDYHHPHAYRHYIPGGTNTAWWYELGPGTIGQSANFATSLSPNDTYNGTTVEYCDPTIIQGSGHSWGMRVDVYASRWPKEVAVTLFDENGDTLWQKKFIFPFGGNDAHALSRVYPGGMAGAASVE